MSRTFRPALAALLGAAVASQAAPAAADPHAASRRVLEAQSTPAASVAAAPELPAEAVCAEVLGASASLDCAGLLSEALCVESFVGIEPSTSEACAEPAAGGEEPGDRAGGARLGDLIEARMARAERARRYDQLEELTTLWLTLKRRDQLDREVGGERFVNAALRNQRYSALRSESRRRAIEAVAPTPLGPAPLDGRLDTRSLVQTLQEPYKTAVELSLLGMNRREVADEMGVSHAAVRKWFQRLRDRLVAAEAV